jgi:hypothetical protein
MNEHAPGHMKLGEQILVGIVAACLISATGFFGWTYLTGQDEATLSRERQERSKAFVEMVKNGSLSSPSPSAKENQRRNQQAMEAWAACMDRMKAHIDTVTNSQIVSCGRLMP